MSGAIEGASILAGLGVLAWAAMSRVGPLLLVSRWLDLARAAGYWLRIAAGAAWERRDRWRECVERARMER